MSNPYAKYLDARDALDVMDEATARLERLVSGWNVDRFSRTYAPGKWDARTILLHLAHTELAFGTRLRLALTTDPYVVQPFDQDEWLKIEPALDGPAALQAFLAFRRFNRPLFGALTADQKARRFTHPERGDLQVSWIAELLAGHTVHHLQQLEQIR